MAKERAKRLILERKATDLITLSDKFKKLERITKVKNYPFRLDQLKEKLVKEILFWKSKKDTNETVLTDLKKDYGFVLSQIGKANPNKEKIDILVKKYNL